MTLGCRVGTVMWGIAQCCVVAIARRLIGGGDEGDDAGEEAEYEEPVKVAEGLSGSRRILNIFSRLPLSDALTHPLPEYHGPRAYHTRREGDVPLGALERTPHVCAATARRRLWK